MRVREGTNLLAGILFTLTAGILLHFSYEWSMENPFVALFAPVNESVWEHLKLLFFPFLLASLAEYFLRRLSNAGGTVVRRSRYGTYKNP